MGTVWRFDRRLHVSEDDGPYRWREYAGNPEERISTIKSQSYVHGFARRKSPPAIQPKAEAGQQWVSVKERVPEKGKAVWIFVPCEGAARFVNQCCPDSWETVTHWMPADCIIPPPPAPEKSEAEKAWEVFNRAEIYTCSRDMECPKDGFIEGWKARDEKGRQ